LVFTVTGKVYESAWKEDNLPAELSIRLDAEKIIYKYHYLDFQNVNASDRNHRSNALNQYVESDRWSTIDELTNRSFMIHLDSNAANATNHDERNPLNQ